MNGRRAVILGGGGVTGLAWEIGVLRGLADEGLYLRNADSIIGTSAGAFAGAYLASGLIDRFYERQFEEAAVEIPAAMPPETIESFRKAIADGGGDDVVTAMALGRLAIAARTVSAEERMAVVASRLPQDGWPDVLLQMTAIDAETGELCLLDRSSGVPLATAAAASGAVPGLWPVVEAEGRKWIDGGSCSATNARLGAAYDRVLVIAPVLDGSPGRPGTRDDIAKLTSHGVAVVLIAPDQHAIEAIGNNPFDPARRGPAADAGRLQGEAAAPKAAILWNVT